MAIVGRTEQGAHEAAEAWRSPLPAHGDLQKAVRRSGANAALIATPPSTHPELVGAALDLGLPVLVEKPMALELCAAFRMSRAADRAGELFMVVQNRSIHPALEVMRHWLTQSEATIGTVHQTYVGAAGDPRQPKGFRHRMAAPLALDMTVHHVDGFAGCSESTSCP